MTGEWRPTGGRAGWSNSHRGVGPISFKKPRGSKSGQRGDLGIGGNQNPGTNGFGGHSGHSESGNGGSSVDEHVSGSDPISAQDNYCWDRPRDGGGAPGGDPGGDDDCGELDPSVVPEPTSFVVWALAGTLLIGITRRPTHRN
jgi:hypothetical protein